MIERKLTYDGVEIRHEPDGKLLAVICDNTFGVETVVKLVDKILEGSSNFSIRGIHTLETHTSFDNNIKIYRQTKEADRQT